MVGCLRLMSCLQDLFFFHIYVCSLILWVIFSIKHISFTLQVHSSIVGMSLFNQCAVIHFFEANKSIFNRFWNRSGITNYGTFLILCQETFKYIVYRWKHHSRISLFYDKIKKRCRSTIPHIFSSIHWLFLVFTILSRDRMDLLMIFHWYSFHMNECVIIIIFNVLRFRFPFALSLHSIILCHESNRLL